MKILFVQPRIVRNLDNLGKATVNLSGTPYMSIQQLASATPKEHSIEMIDERFKKIDFEEKCDLVAIMKCFETLRPGIVCLLIILLVSIRLYCCINKYFFKFSKGLPK